MHLSGFITDYHFDHILSRIHQSSWDSFLLSDFATPLAKSTADVLITQLVQNNHTNTNTNPPNKTETTRKYTRKTIIPNVFRADAFTSTFDDFNHGLPTHVDAYTHHSNKEEPVLQEKEKKEPKPKKSKLQNIIATDEPLQDDSNKEEPAEKPVIQEKAKKEPKPKKSKLQNIIAADEPVPGQDDSNKDGQEKTKKEPKKREHTISHFTEHSLVDVVIPVIEIPFKSDDELTYDSFDSTLELTETFVNNILFYVDSEGNWFDSNLFSTFNPHL